MKINNAIFVFVIAFTVFVTASGIASAAPNDHLFFGSAENLSGLNVAKATGTAPSGEYSVETIRFEIDAAKCSIHTVPDAQGYVYLKVADLKPCTKPGEPQLPMKTFIIKLPKNAEVLGAEMKYGNYREIENKLNIVPMPQPVPIILPEEKAGKRIADTKIYSRETYFPGKAISYDAGSDGKHKIVLLRIFPVQYVPAEKKAILITDAEVSVYYREREESKPFFPAATFDVPQEDILNAENLIITPPELFEHAKELENFHDDRGTSTEVVNTTWIFSNFNASDDPPFEGYKNSSIEGWNNIIGYNYSLAKRTIMFLNDHSAHPNLEYVTLFGNARLVPPSYYVYINHYDTYNNWIPTDFFYASPDYDFVSNYMIGRIPVNNSEEAEHVVQKIKDWDANISYDWFKNVVLIGGTPVWYPGSRYYRGELTTVDSANLGYFEGMNVTKLYLSNGDYTPEKVQTAYKSDYGFIYHYTHGSGYAMVKADPHEGYVNTIDTTILENLPANTNVSIVVSCACMNGAFDTNLYPNTPEGYDGPPPICFGEGVLLSNAAGIAYIGGSRVTRIWADVYIDKGYLHVIKELWMPGMLTYLFEAYHNGSNTLGNMTKTAMETYVEENVFNSWENLTIFEFTLLGDPALQLPAQQPSGSYQQPFSTALNPDHYTDDDKPVYNTSTNITINSTTDSPEVFTKRIDTFTFTTVEKMENATTGNSFEYTFSSTNETEYLVRTETEDGKEGWLYLTVVSPWNKTGMVLVVDDDYVREYERYYEDALAANGYTYDTWDVVLRGSPDNRTLAQYEAVVWLTEWLGPEWFISCPTLTAKNQEDLATYLDSGGKLFISGQLIGYDLVVKGMGEEFYHNYLHADFVNYT